LFVDVKSSFQIKGRRPWIQFAKLRRRPNEEKNESNDAIFKRNHFIIDVASFEKMFKCPKLIQIFVVMNDTLKSRFKNLDYDWICNFESRLELHRLQALATKL
jgi:hypothetical protein